MGRKALLTRGLVARGVGFPGDLLRLGPGARALAGSRRPRTIGRAVGLPATEGTTALGQGVLAAVSLLFIAWLILMPLDAMRFEWSEVPGWLQFLGALGLVLSLYVVFLTFRENAYLAPVVKLQEERGQSVVSTGPYWYVRHPMYSSMFLFFPGSALLLGSWGGLLFCAMLLGLLVWRIPLEERMLKNELAGYEEYAQSVRYRLIP